MEESARAGQLWCLKWTKSCQGMSCISRKQESEGELRCQDQICKSIESIVKFMVSCMSNEPICKSAIICETPSISRSDVKNKNCKALSLYLFSTKLFKGEALHLAIVRLD